MDSFILERLRAVGLSPVADAKPTTLVRRMFFDLTGLPPTPSQIETFLTAYRRDEQRAVTQLADTLLSSPQFGENWACLWLDLVRYAESNGGDRNVAYPHAWRYRNYVIAAFNTDKPYDLFLRETQATLDSYGIGEQRHTDDFGRQCLLARRLAEAGVRFIELTHDNWDHHGGVSTLMPARCGEIDQPIAALLNDLKAQGLMDDTLIVWGGEFGRTPDDPRGDGRGHNRDAGVMWLAGGGVKSGFESAARLSLGAWPQTGLAI